MERNIELMNSILREMRASPYPCVTIYPEGQLGSPLAPKDRAEAYAAGDIVLPVEWWVLDEHVRLLEEGGFIVKGADCLQLHNTFKMTNDGYNYIEAMDVPGVWERVQGVKGFIMEAKPALEMLTKFLPTDG